MLNKFTVRNYKGFKEPISLDFSDYKEYKYNAFAIKDGLIKTSVIYGKNASGKSNFGLALFDITSHLTDNQKFPQQQHGFLNADSDEDSAEFVYELTLKDRKLRYTYRKTDFKTLSYEELYLDEKKVFSYNFAKHRGDFASMNLIEAETLKINPKNMNISVVRFIANNANLPSQSILMTFMKFVQNMLWYRSLGINSYIGYTKGRENILNNIIENGKLDDFQKYLSDMGIRYDLEAIQDAFKNKLIGAKFKHSILPFWEIASSGTQSLTLHYFWSQRFSDVSFLFIDEFDAYYHTHLAEEIVRFISKKTKFQTIFTTHNTSLMSNHLLRPDCYFILSEGKLNALPNCTERELREGHNLEKMFKNGEFI